MKRFICILLLAAFSLSVFSCSSDIHNGIEDKEILSDANILDFDYFGAEDAIYVLYGFVEDYRYYDKDRYFEASSAIDELMDYLDQSSTLTNECIKYFEYVNQQHDLM